MNRRTAARKGAKLQPAWMDAQYVGKIKRLRDKPKHYHLMVQAALRRMRLRYWHQVLAWNPWHRPAGKYDEGIQAIDFIVQGQGVRFAILVRNPANLNKPNEKAAWTAKIKLLEERNIPTLILKHNDNDYYAQIMLFQRKEQRHGQ